MHHFRLSASLVWLASATALVMVSLSLGLEAHAQHRGVYCLMNNKQVIDQAWLQGKDNIAALFICINWAQVQTGKNTYDWAYLDQCFTKANNAGKKVYLRVKPGTSTPGWAYQEGIDYVTLPDGTKCPKPWDTTYQSLWATFVDQLDIRYKNRAAFMCSGQNHLYQ